MRPSMNETTFRSEKTPLQPSQSQTRKEKLRQSTPSLTAARDSTAGIGSRTSNYAPHTAAPSQYQEDLYCIFRNFIPQPHRQLRRVRTARNTAAPLAAAQYQYLRTSHATVGPPHLPPQPARRTSPRQQLSARDAGPPTPRNVLVNRSSPGQHGREL